MKIAVVTHRGGFTSHQIEAFKKTISLFNPDSASILLGGEPQDELALNIALSLGFSIIVYPQQGHQLANGFTDPTLEHMDELPFADRNRRMVEDANVIIAVPMIIFEMEDSPLWKTTRYAITKGKEVYALSNKGHVWVTGEVSV